MYASDNSIIDAKFNELLASVSPDELQQTMRARLKRNSHLVVGAVLVDDENKICLVREAKAPYAGKWNLPLGHLEHGETLTAGAIREVKEETGYDIKLIELLPPQNASHDNSFRILYVGKVLGGSPEKRLENDTTNVGWFSFPEIEQKFNKYELRDIYVWHDVLLYRSGVRLPLNLIKEVTSSEE